MIVERRCEASLSRSSEDAEVTAMRYDKSADVLFSGGKLMAERGMGSSQEVLSRNGHDSLESKLRSLFADQQRLREELERTRPIGSGQRRGVAVPA